MCRAQISRMAIVGTEKRDVGFEIDSSLFLTTFGSKLDIVLENKVSNPSFRGGWKRTLEDAAARAVQVMSARHWRVAVAVQNTSPTDTKFTWAVMAGCLRAAFSTCEKRCAVRAQEVQERITAQTEVVITDDVHVFTNVPSTIFTFGLFTADELNVVHSLMRMRETIT